MKPTRTSQGERYAMNETTNVLRLRQPDEIEDPLTDVLRTGARKLLAQAIEIEAETFLAEMRDLKLADGRARIVRHGHGPERSIQTGIGPVPVSRVKIRDRGANGEVDRLRLVGSHNWTTAGTGYNRDASLIFYDRDIAKFYQDIFLYDWNRIGPAKVDESLPMPIIVTAANDTTPHPGYAAVPLSEILGR